MLKGKHIVLGISGGIAAYKSVSLLRLLVKRGAEVQVVITPAGKEFITPVTLAALSGRPVVSEFFTANTGEWHSHVDLGLWADLMVVAPATASTLAKMATGVADNMLVTTYLSAKEHVMVAPSMDLDMWAHPSTQRNIRILEQDGVTVIQPGAGELASHLVGKGRMEEPEKILEHIEGYFRSMEEEHVMQGSLAGERVLITAGPTHEYLDPVRFLGNASSGKMGFALAAECAVRGAEVILVAGPVSLSTPEVPFGSGGSITRHDVCSAEEMRDVCVSLFGSCTAAILAAAVADYAPMSYSEHKIKREGVEEITLCLRRNPDIAATLGERKGDRLLVGFALESDNEEVNALGKMQRKNLDAIVLNSLRDVGAGFNTDTNKVTIYFRDGRRESWPLKSKKEVAADIVTALLGNRGK